MFFIIFILPRYQNCTENITQAECKIFKCTSTFPCVPCNGHKQFCSQVTRISPGEQAQALFLRITRNNLCFHQNFSCTVSWKICEQNISTYILNRFTSQVPCCDSVLRTSYISCKVNSLALLSFPYSNFQEQWHHVKLAALSGWQRRNQTLVSPRLWSPYWGAIYIFTLVSNFSQIVSKKWKRQLSNSLKIKF